MKLKKAEKISGEPGFIDMLNETISPWKLRSYVNLVIDTNVQTEYRDIGFILVTQHI